MSGERGLSVEVRRFQPGDGKRIRVVDDRARTAAAVRVPHGPDRDLHAVPRYYLRGDGEFLVGTVDETIVATGAYVPPARWKATHIDIDGRTVELARMRVDPEWQRRGIGSAVYAELEARARAVGHRRVLIDTVARNAAARRFYESLGFDCAQTLTLEQDAGTVDAALYEKTIDG